MIATILRYNESGPGGATNTLQGLTHSLELTKEGLGMNPTRICSVDGCGLPNHARNLCNAHYGRWRTYGDPLKGYARRGRTPSETLQLRATPSGDCLIWAASLSDRGYGRIFINGVFHMAHRFAWEQANGAIPPGMYIDHICHNRACVNVEHLRLATPQENTFNAGGASKSSTTKLRNVFFDSRRGKYRVQVMKDRKTHWGGYFESASEAARAAEALRAELFGDFAGNG